MRGGALAYACRFYSKGLTLSLAAGFFVGLSVLTSDVFIFCMNMAAKFFFPLYAISNIFCFLD